MAVELRYRPLHVVAQHCTKLLVRRELGIVCGTHEAVDEPLRQIAHVAVARAHRDEVALVAAGLGIGRRSTDDLSPVRRQTLNVLRMLAGMREGMVELRVREASLVVCARKPHPRVRTAGELVDGRSRHRWSQPGRSRQNSLPSGSRNTAKWSPSKTSSARTAPTASVAATAASKSTVARSRCTRFLTVFGSGTRRKSSRGHPFTCTVASPSSSYSILPPTTRCHHSASAAGCAQSK